MPQLPRARRNQNYNLPDAVPDRPTVSKLAKISKVGLSLSLVLLFSPDILEFLVQITKLGGQFAHV